MPLFSRLALSLVCFTAITAFGDEADTPCADGGKVHRATIRHIESKGIGYNVGYTTLETFLSADPSRWCVTPFLDLRAHLFNNGRWATNVGTGLRKIWGTRAYGLNTYYDYRNTNRFHYNQIGVGLETLGQFFDFRINGYFPVGKKISKPYQTTFGGFSGHHLLVSQKYQFALKGVDTEFGFHLGKSKSFKFYAAGGPYYYRGKLGSNIWGGKARLSATYKDLLKLELSDSYDGTFHNRFQGQISLNFFFGPKSKSSNTTCTMLQPIVRQEIIPVNSKKKNSVAIDPATGQPYFFVFVDNTSSSDGTYESPYHSFSQVEANSAPGNIIYVFPGDGTTTGMNSGILLKANQSFWGSGISHLIPTSQGTISIPAQTSSPPTITNTNVDTEGNAVTLASRNDISGFNITSALNDAIYGTNPQSLSVSSCVIQNTTTFPIEATFSSNASVSITNNQFLNNVNGVSLTLNGTSTAICSGNTFSGQTSVSNTPIEISATSNTVTTRIENNVFNNNTTGGIRFALDSVTNASISVLNNTITNNGTGSQSSLGSSFVIVTTGTNQNGSITLSGNTFSDNDSNALYLHTSGAFTTLSATVSDNTMSNNGGSALVFATPAQTLTLVATDNTLSTLNDNGIAIISSGTTTTGNITINNNTITNIENNSNGIAVNQDFTTLNLTILDNTINTCEGTGILSYAPTGIDSLTLNVSDNTISHCSNGSSNAASALDIEQYTTLAGTVTNNTLSNNTSTAVTLGSALTAPTACLTLSGNTNTADYLLTNPVDGTLNLSPCDVGTVNTGTINTSGTITPVQSCPGATPCPPFASCNCNKGNSP